MAAQHINGAIHLDALVVGAGFGGCYLLHLLRKQGLRVKLVDALDGFGGVWRANWYPGARVDCEMPYYLFSAPELMKGWVWTERYPAASELRRYFEHVDKIWQLSKDTSFNTRVTGARYNEHAGVWHVETHKGDRYTCRWFLPATGTSNKQHWPDWPGLGEFHGQMYHPAAWPRDQGDILKDKRVAVIGAGASAIQIVEQAAKTANHLTQFILTPNIAVPMRQRSVSPAEVDSLRPQIPSMMSHVRSGRIGLPLQHQRASTRDATPAEREQIWETGWQDSGFALNAGAFADVVIDKEANRLAYEFWLQKTQSRISDPQKRAILAPDTMPYYFSTKRPSMEQDYYEMVSLSHVAITNSPIKAVNATGLITEDGQHHAADIIVVCTGYDAVVGSLRDMNIIGRAGESITQHWKEGIYTYLGLTCHGFPNMSFVYGPQAPSSFTAGPPFIEQQVEWIVDLIARSTKEGWDTIEATREAEEEWRKFTLDIADRTLFVETDSWYMGCNVPGKRREMMLFVGGMDLYFERCRDVLQHGLKGFNCHTSIVSDGNGVGEVETKL